MLEILSRKRKHISTVHLIVDPHEMNLFGGTNNGANRGYRKKSEDMQIHGNH